MEKKYTTKFITRTAILLALALIFQIGLKGVGQPLVGPLVNFVLIISACTVGTLSGVIIGTLTPIIAFVLGIMGFFPVVPFIIVGNILYVVLYNSISKKARRGGDVLGIVLASLIKYVFLSLSVRYVVVLFAIVPPKMIAVFSIPQLYNALIGGVLAIIVKAFLPKSMFLRS